MCRRMPPMSSGGAFRVLLPHHARRRQPRHGTGIASGPGYFFTSSISLRIPLYLQEEHFKL
jgi:hypothetical protein